MLTYHKVKFGQIYGLLNHLSTPMLHNILNKNSSRSVQTVAIITGMKDIITKIQVFIFRLKMFAHIYVCILVIFTNDLLLSNYL